MKRQQRIETLRSAINRIETGDIEVFEFGQRPRSFLERVMKEIPGAAAERAVWPIESEEDLEDAVEWALLHILRDKVEVLLARDRKLILRLAAELLSSNGHAVMAQELLRKEGDWR